jgi:hypothetical protein
MAAIKGRRAYQQCVWLDQHGRGWCQMLHPETSSFKQQTDAQVVGPHHTDVTAASSCAIALVAASTPKKCFCFRTLTSHTLCQVLKWQSSEQLRSVPLAEPVAHWLSSKLLSCSRRFAQHAPLPYSRMISSCHCRAYGAVTLATQVLALPSHSWRAPGTCVAGAA